MDVRRKLALLLTAAVCSLALTLSALMPAPDIDDPLAPIGPLALLDDSQPPDPAMMGPLHREASAALDALQAASDHPQP